VKGVYWVLPGLLAGRAGPGEEPWDLAALWEGGFRTIVSLNGLRSPEIAAAGFRHYSRLLNGTLALFSLPRRWLAWRMLPILDKVATELAEGRPVLVHCRQGRDRTGAFLSAYLVRHEGWEPQAAVDAVREANPLAMASRGFDQLAALCRK
jgi:hypothetical protein